MTEQGIRYTALAALVAAAVAAAAARAVAPGSLTGVLVGAAAGFAVQVAVFWMFMVRLFPGRVWHAYGVGLLVRFAAFAVVALVAVPQAGLPLGATLFPLAAVFWLTTLMEPAFFKPRTPKTRQA
ncbi:hypothetical protein [Longimicrobium sp.]|uniref:hypothetical protein n=1 Tax=Longimicrobium sp. TaxID=2029185 RepID=UPI002CC9173B|nr:hypothetical protein [Longimicrobium sp.]HSU16466.1 hypothetical protein [Longimicrobium sp.]